MGEPMSLNGAADPTRENPVPDGRTGAANVSSAVFCCLAVFCLIKNHDIGMSYPSSNCGKNGATLAPWHLAVCTAVMTTAATTSQHESTRGQPEGT